MKLSRIIKSGIQINLENVLQPGRLKKDIRLLKWRVTTSLILFISYHEEDILIKRRVTKAFTSLILSIPYR